jgi:hypothetical protein
MFPTSAILVRYKKYSLVDAERSQAIDFLSHNRTIETAFPPEDSACAVHCTNLEGPSQESICNAFLLDDSVCYLGILTSTFLNTLNGQGAFKVYSRVEI